VRRIGGDAKTNANFEPKTYMDQIVYGEYCSRSALDASLPPVPFTRKDEGLFYLGLRKCEIELVNDVPFVKQGGHLENFVSWLEKVERVEALRSKGMKSANMMFTFQQTGLL